MTSYCCLHLQCLFDRWHTMSDYLLWWILWHKQISLGSMWHLPGLSPSGENVKSLFFKKIWSKIRVWLIHECSLYTNVAYRRVNSVDLSYITHFVRSKHLIIKKVFVQEKVLAFWDQIICGHGKKKRSLVNNCTSNWHLLYNLCTNLSIKMDLILTNYVKTFPKLKLWD